MTQWEGTIKHICFWEPTWCPFGNIYFINSYTWLGGKTKCQHLSSETFILCKSRFDYTFLFELMRLWLEWVRWSMNKFRKIDFFVLGPVPSVYDHISVESRITFRRRSLFLTRRPSDQFASIHPMWSASVPCNTKSFCYWGRQSVLRWVKNLNILMVFFCGKCNCFWVIIHHRHSSLKSSQTLSRFHLSLRMTRWDCACFEIRITKNDWQKQSLGGRRKTRSI